MRYVICRITVATHWAEVQHPCVFCERGRLEADILVAIARTVLTVDLNCTLSKGFARVLGN